MANIKTLRPRKPRPSPGRPPSSDASDARSAIIQATRKLLEVKLPGQVTMSIIAREAGVDPALIRYYFGDRESLLLAVVDELLMSARQPAPTGPMTAETFFNWRVMRTLSFARSARSMQRLLIDELVESAQPSMRDVVIKRNANAISYYKGIQQAQVTDEVLDVDQLFLYIAILGMCEFFTAAQSIVRPLAGEGVDPKELSDRYGEFVVDLLLNGLLKK